MKTKLPSLILIAACLALLCATSLSLQAATITVTTTNDNGAGSLRAALAGAGNGDTIDATGVAGTITLTTGQLNVPNSVTILGPGPGALTVSGNNASGVFNVTGTNVTITGLTIANGQTTSDGAGLNAAGSPGSVLTLSGCVIINNNADGNGGGIYINPDVTMTISNCTVSGNWGTDGGGIYNDGTALTIDASTLSGNSAGDGGGIYNDGTVLTINASALSDNSANAEPGVGGGIYNDGTALTINASTLSGNSAGDGGGIYNDGTALTIDASTLSGNSADADGGGGIYNNIGETMTISNCTVSGNSGADGGGICNGGGSLIVAASTLSGNTAGNGGGIYNDGGDFGSASLTINSSTLSANSAGTGGGIYNDAEGGAEGGGIASLTINASTFSGNSAGTGGGIYNDSGDFGSAILEIGDTILNTGATGGNIYNNGFGAFSTSDGYNLSSDNGGGFLTATGDQINTDPKLGPLQNNGGPTWTHALLAGSPAIDQGKANAVPGLGLATDQRGFPRPVDAADIPNAPGGDGSDIGAFEVQVVSTADSGPGSLRAALAGATNGATVDATSLTGTITLTTGQLNVPNSVTVLGPGPGALTVSGNNASGVFNVTGTNVTISGLTIANGQSAENGAGINAGGGPGSTLAIDSCIVISNFTSSAGGGGGIYNSPGGTMIVSNCTLSLNSASSGSGGGICNDRATLIVVGSTLSANYGALGGGIGNNGSAGNAIVTLNVSTISSNSSYLGGGGIVNWGQSGSATLTINASTFSGNSATGSGGGSICNNGSLGTGRVEVADCILSAGAVGGNIYNYAGTVISGGYNLSSDNGGGFLTATNDRINTNPLLGPLQNNGGPTWTCALLPGSPAIDAGKCNAITNLVCATDQRGLLRVVDLPDYPNVPGGDGSDIGAYEVQVDAALLTRPSFNTNGAGWYLNGDTVNGGPNITNNVFTLTDGAGGENRSAWFSEPLYVGGFQASFTYQDIGGGGADGAAFVIQNDPSGTAALGLNGGGLGYVGITPSVAVLLNIYWYSPGGAGLMLGTNGVGAYYASGANSGRSYQSTAPVNLAGGDPIAVALRYTGGILYASLTDTVTSNNFQTSIAVDIPAFVGTNAAWVGFTGSEGGTTSHQIVSNFSYRPLPTLIIRQSQPASLVFTWPAAVCGFTLQSNSSLNNPAGWTSVAGTSTQTNGLNQVTTPSPTSTQFYRLVLPGGP